jgi:hypothetical protein
MIRRRLFLAEFERWPLVTTHTPGGPEASSTSGVNRNEDPIGIRYQGSVGSQSLALTFSWLTLHSAISMSSRTLPKYFA